MSRTCKKMHGRGFVRVADGGSWRMFPVRPIEVIFSSIGVDVEISATIRHPPLGWFKGRTHASRAAQVFICASPLRGAKCLP
jgi:hypothetical protein